MVIDLNACINQPLAFLFQQDVVMLNGFGTVVNALGKRVKPYLPQICGTILWRLNNKSAKVRQQAADLISRIAIVMKTCQEVRACCMGRDSVRCTTVGEWRQTLQPHIP